MMFVSFCYLFIERAAASIIRARHGTLLTSNFVDRARTTDAAHRLRGDFISKLRRECSASLHGNSAIIEFATHCHVRSLAHADLRHPGGADGFVSIAGPIFWSNAFVHAQAA